MRRALLVLNTGSSSIKFAVHDAESAARLADGAIEGIGRAADLTLRHAGATHRQPVEGGHLADTGALLEWLLQRLCDELGPMAVTAAGHRVVHGGQQFRGPVVVTAAVMQALQALCPLAPGHQPHNLAGIRAVAARWPDSAQIACFDTAFHQTRPRVAQIFAVPRALSDEGILRYGFHGLSFDHIAGRLAEVLGDKVAQGKVIVAHLGSGASLCAMQNGKSIDTTMGFTALDGLMMGTRCGQIDPGVLLHLMREKGLDGPALETLLGRESGLLGVSGISADMRDLLDSPAPQAAEAVALFVHMILRQIGALTASLGGLDGLVFTAGIGERSAAIRMQVMAGLDWLGLVPDEDANRAHGPLISAPRSAVAAAMIPTDEEAVILRAVLALRG
ncbi:acetate kinase [Roseinatronobacter thiooxidans]|uniref:Acetate kinase n=1 Tax=Roseinatronobacter thiooxidans TaxID=121821 RepID=A0A2W7PTJ5_9RHOB|nr:acetate/propionate family kinase [Roseinatronobacter thiooxidans]PZX39541.1 acetate kinase [Roseinatronobacter thiooxidans]